MAEVIILDDENSLRTIMIQKNLSQDKYGQMKTEDRTNFVPLFIFILT